MNDITYRAARASDWDGIAALLTVAGLPTADLSAAHVECFIVAMADSELVGAVALQAYDDVGLFRSLVVAAACRGRDIGAGLAQQVETRARRDGVRELWLLTIDAGDYFARHGWLPAAREDAPDAIAATAEFSALCPASAGLYRKSL